MRSEFYWFIVYYGRYIIFLFFISVPLFDRRKDPQYSPPAKNEDTSKSRC